MSNVLLFRRRHLIEVERASSSHVWRERFLVEVRAATVKDACDQLACSLGATETIVSTIIGPREDWQAA